MKAFGIELRRVGGINAHSLYQDVDRVLRTAGVTSESVGAALQQQTVAHALNKMFQVDGKYGHFSVCTVKELADLCQVVISAQRYQVYSSIHCMKWCEMTPEYRATVCAMVLDDFREVLTAEILKP